MAKTDCPAKGIIMSGEVSWGNEAQPLYEAGSKNIGCVIELEAMATINVQKATFEDAPSAWEGDVSFAGKTLTQSVVRFSLSAQSGQAYFMQSAQASGLYRRSGA